MASSAILAVMMECPPDTDGKMVSGPTGFKAAEREDAQRFGACLHRERRRLAGVRAILSIRLPRGLPMFLMSFLALGVVQPVSAQAGPVVPPHRWTVDYSRLSCTLARRLDGEGSAIVAVNARLGEEPGELVVMDGGGGLDRRLVGNLEIRIDDGPPLVLRANRETRNGRSIAVFRPMPDDFLGRIAGARQIVLSRGDEVVLSLAVPDARSAVEALTRCNNDLLQSWGIDVAARRALRREPRLTDFQWINNIQSTADTFLIFAVEVSERGEALDCRIVVSTRNAGMDRAVCALVRSRARFQPALDSAGNPTRAQYVNLVRWVVETD